MESLRPVSESSVWEWLAGFYRERGLEAWTSGSVPQRVTSNAYLADVYAAVIAAFARDLQRQDVEASPLILEVGGGSGLFAWLLLNRLLRHHGDGTTPGFQYLLTEADPARIRAWSQVDRLAGLVDQGPLHLGVLAIDGPAPRVVAASDGTHFDLTKRPLVLVANYVMDALPTDLLRVRGGRVLREFVAIEGDPFGADGLSSLAGITTRFEPREIAPPYTGHPGVDAVIESYRALPGDPCIPVSMAFVSFLEPLLDAEAPLLMLAGDLAYTTTEFATDPPLVHHDYLACTANFHLLGKLFEQRGGNTAFTRHADPQFSAGAFLQPGGGVDLTRTREAALVALGHFGPHDALNVEEALSSHEGPLDFNMVSGWLRLARFDACVAALCIPHLMRIIEADEPYERGVLREMLLEAYRSELPEGTGEESLATRIAFLFFRARMYRDTVDFLDLARSEIGQNGVGLHLRAAATARLGHADQAAALLGEIAKREPDYWTGWPVGDGGAPAPDLGRLGAEDAVHCDHMVLRLSVAAFRKIREGADARPARLQDAPAGGATRRA